MLRGLEELTAGQGDLGVFVFVMKLCLLDYFSLDPLYIYLLIYHKAPTIHVGQHIPYMSDEKRASWLLRGFVGDYTAQLCGDYFINQYRYYKGPK